MEKNKDKIAVVIGITLIAGVIGITFIRPIIKKRLAQIPQIEKVLPDLTEQYPFISVSDLETQIKKKSAIILIDSRPASEFKQEHVLNSINIESDAVTQFLKGKGSVTKLVLIGNNFKDLSTKLLAEELKRNNQENFAILSGGLESWIGSGGRTIRLGNPTALSDQAKINTIKPEALKQLIDSKNSQLYVLDLRSEKSFASDHIPQAKNIPGNLLEEKNNLLPIGKRIVYYAGSEIETFQLGVTLFDLGISRAEALEGGLDAWKNKGFPLEK